MSDFVFDHEKLDVYRLTIRYVSTSYETARTLSGIHRHVRDQWLRAAQSILLNIAEGNGKQSAKEKSHFFDIARGSALECAAIEDILLAFAVHDDQANSRGKMQLKRIVEMLTRLIQRKRRTAAESDERAK